MTVLQREPGRTVTLEAGGATVRKTFDGHDHALLVRLAAREFERMAGFHEALADLDGATCARPLELGVDPEPYVRMERAAGEPMQDHLARNVWETERMTQVAETLQQALLRYVITFGEPYWDFILRNMFYDDAADLVTFLDFGIPVIYEPILPRLERTPPLEVSLGGLVASAVFEAGRPRRMGRRREHRQAPQLVRAVVDRSIGAGEGLEVTRAGVRTVARSTYQMAASGGGWTRRQWYRLAGSLLAAPAQIDGLCEAAAPAGGQDGHDHEGASSRPPPVGGDGGDGTVE